MFSYCRLRALQALAPAKYITLFTTYSLLLTLYYLLFTTYSLLLTADYVRFKHLHQQSTHAETKDRSSTYAAPGPLPSPFPQGQIPQGADAGNLGERVSSSVSQLEVWNVFYRMCSLTI